MNLALVLALAIFIVVLVPTVMIVGITAGMQSVITNSPTALQLNTTMWNTYLTLYAGYGLVPLLILVGLALAALVCGYYLVVAKT